MNDSPLRARLLPLMRRVRWRRLARATALAWVTMAGVAAIVWLGLWALGVGSPLTTPVLGGAAFFATLWVWWREGRKPISDRVAAETVEGAFPELNSLVLTATQQMPGRGGRLHPLQERVVAQALAHDTRHPWRTAIPFSGLVQAWLLPLAAMPFLLLTLWLNHIPFARRTESPERGFLVRSGVEVTPGDIQLEKGESLVVLARFGGQVPMGAELVYRNNLGREQRAPLKRNLKDPVFGGSVSEVGEDLTYRVEYAGKVTKEYKVKVFEHPRLERADAELTYPTYTGLAQKRIDDTKRISAIEGTRVDLWLQLNKPVRTALLAARGTNYASLPLQIAPNRALVQLSQYALESSGTYDLRLVDDEGRTNKVSSSFVLEALKNRVPEMRLASPKGDLRPSALEEIRFEGTMWDDFGISAYGIAYTIAGGDVRTVELGTNVAAQTKTPFQFELRLEELGARPDQLVAWFVWSEDLGPDGQLRRNQGDMFFGEVRPFETVFREGEGGGGGEGGESGEEGGDGVKKLAELQKQIISATWKLQREYGARRAKSDSKPAVDSETKSPPKPRAAAGVVPAIEQSPIAGMAAGEDGFRERWIRGSAVVMAQTPREETPPRQRARAQRLDESGNRRPGPAAGGPRSGAPVSFATDLQVVREAMDRAIKQARDTMESQEDPRSSLLWSTVVVQMEAAVKELSAAKSPSDLAKALTAQQAAYDALLKLRARESEITRGQRSQSSSASQGEQMTDRQMEQLDLQQSENKYETQRQARAAQNPQQREQQQVLNRLAELARRQQDMNTQLKELQTALQEARTEAEREAYRRQLKRLQDEQRQMLADVDELQQRMNREENQSRMSEQRQQLEQTRNELQQSAEATGEGQVSQALSSGTRAQRQLQDMRENLRRQNSSQLAEELKELRSESREIAQKQSELTKDFSTPPETGKKSLSSTDNSEALAKRLAEQRERMTNLIARATEISEQVETTEPLVSHQLYDALRKFATDDTTNVKRMREQLVRDGVLSESGSKRLKEIAEGEGAKALQVAEEFVQRGGRQIAQNINQLAGRDIENLTRGLERAAESVLGDDTEMLRMAQQELEALTAQLQRELAQNRGTNGSPNSPGTPEGAGQAKAGDRPGNQGSGARTNAANASAAGQGSAPERSAQSPQSAQAAPSEQSGDNPGASPESGNAQAAGRRGQPGGRPQGQPSSSQQPPTPSAGNQPGQSPSESQAANGEGSPSAEGGNGSEGNANAPAGAGGRPQNANSPPRRQQQRLGGNPQTGGNRNGGEDLSSFFGGGRETLEGRGPITGGDYAEWSDRLRDVEEMIEQPELRNQVASARDRARLMRIEYNREGKKPDWATMDLKVIRPLVEVRSRIDEELARRGSRDTLIPLDRDPVPNKYAELVRRYYEQLGREK